MNAIAPITAAASKTTTRTEHARHRFTVEDVMRMTEVGILDPDARIELMDGELIDMPGEGTAHVWFKVLLNQLIVRLLPPGFFLAPDATLNLSPHDAPEPDIYVVEGVEPFADIEPAHVRLVLEVADSSVSYDVGRKRRKYAAFGISEYWVLDVPGRRIHRFRHPDAGDYVDRSEHAFDAALSPERIPGLTIVIADLPGVDGLTDQALKKL